MIQSTTYPKIPSKDFNTWWKEMFGIQTKNLGFDKAKQVKKSPSWNENKFIPKK